MTFLIAIASAWLLYWLYKKMPAPDESIVSSNQTSSEGQRRTDNGWVFEIKGIMLDFDLISDKLTIKLNRKGCLLDRITEVNEIEFDWPLSCAVLDCTQKTKEFIDGFYLSKDGQVRSTSDNPRKYPKTKDFLLNEWELKIYTRIGEKKVETSFSQVFVGGVIDSSQLSSIISLWSNYIEPYQKAYKEQSVIDENKNKELKLDAARKEFKETISKCGIENDFGWWDYSSKSFSYSSFIAIDKRGLAAIKTKNEVWSGSLSKAVARIVVGNDAKKMMLEIELDDKEYENRNLRVCRFSLMPNESKDELQQWVDRINILSRIKSEELNLNNDPG